MVSFTLIWVLFSFSFVFSCYYCRPIAVCFVANLLQRAIIALTVGFFVDFHVDVSDDKISIRLNNHIKSCSLVCCRSRISGILGIF